LIFRHPIELSVDSGIGSEMAGSESRPISLPFEFGGEEDSGIIVR